MLTLLSGLVVQLLLGAESMPAEPPPDWFGQLATAGCRLATDDTIRCEVDSEVWRQGCDALVRESLLLGLDEPVVWCLTYPRLERPWRRLRDDQFFHHRPLHAPASTVYPRLLVVDGGVRVLIRNSEQLAQRYAPVDSPAEALAFAIAVTGFAAEQGVRGSFVGSNPTQIPDTTVEKIEGGFLVRAMRDDSESWCAGRVVHLADVAVDVSGTVSVVARSPGYESSYGSDAP